jgi:hypothetical protein
LPLSFTLPSQAESIYSERFPWVSACCSAVFLVYTPIKAIEHDVCQQKNLSLHIKEKAMLKDMMLTVIIIDRIKM